MLSPLVLITVLLSNAAPGLRDTARETARKELREQLETLAGPLASTARISLQVESLDDGTVTFSKGGNELVNIASNTKLFSTAAALATLGPDYEFTTELFAPDLRNGKAKALFVRGKGDPSLTTERLYGIAAELLHAGLREVSGDLVLDETWFDAQRTPRGYDQEETDFAYMAPTGALSLHANAVGLYVLPARPGVKPQVTVDPPSDYVTVDTSRLSGQCPRPDLGVKSRPDGEKQKLVVFGCLVDPRAGARVWKKIDQPAFYFGHTFKRVLADRGIQLKGKVRLGAAPKDATPLLVARSESLADVLKKINKRSINFAAETLLKTMAAEKVGTPATFASGLKVVADFLERDVGIARGTYVMDNGSGLNDANRFTSAQVNKLLRYMNNRFDLAPDYLASLGIAGVDGTLRNRFGKTDAAGNLRGKTGTLSKVTAVSGYVRAGSGERFTFSLVANDFPVRVAEVRRGLDSLGAA
ncbi:MAG: D-alanyl-D-alanine carboxypeptidase/D-alanyl-D-alanine endopeptidase, partial [Myxococcaceae bacterium]